MSAPRVRIVEVGPRDGLQNESRILEPAVRRELVERLVRAGLQDVEAGAFVSPRAVPQMAGSGGVLSGLARTPGVRYPVLVPNVRGFEDALAAGANYVAVFAAASETFSQKNIRCSIEESLQRYAEVLAHADETHVPVRGYVSCVVECPYEGPIRPESVAAVAAELHDMGCEEISLGDTIGTGTPGTVLPMLECVARRVPLARLAGHYHDTYGMAVANCYASWRFGLRTFDSSVGGLGGCPYAPGARGNVATEDLAWLFEGLGVPTGIDLPALIECARWIGEHLGHEPGSRVYRALVSRTAAH